MGKQSMIIRKRSIKILFVLLLIAFFMTAGFIVFNRIRADQTISQANGSSSSNQSSGIAPAQNSSVEPDIKTQTVVNSEKAASSNIPVLMYHHIKNPDDPSSQLDINLSVPPDQFELQMASLNNHKYKSITVSQLFDLPQTNKVALTFDDGYKNLIQNAFPVMQKYHLIGTAHIIVNDVGKDGYMDWDDIKTLKKAGWEIGSHTLSHPDLSTISLAQASSQIFESKKVLEQNLGVTIESFCYPSGKYNADVENLVKEAGYTSATTTHSGLKNTSEKSLELNRLRINGPDSLGQFEKKVY